jgi:hypothetical protein
MDWQELETAKKQGQKVMTPLKMTADVNAVGRVFSWVFFPATYTQGKVYGFLKEYPNAELTPA